MACHSVTLPYRCSNSTHFLHRIYPGTHSSIMSFLNMVTFLSVPDITQVNLACISKACLLLCTKRPCQLLHRVTEWPALPCAASQPASYITSSPSLGHVTPLMGDGCLPTKDSWVMALILTSRRGKITCHSQSVCCKPEQIQRGRGSRGVLLEETEQPVSLSESVSILIFMLAFHILSLSLSIPEGHGPVGLQLPG